MVCLEYKDHRDLLVCPVVMVATERMVLPDVTVFPENRGLVVFEERLVVKEKRVSQRMLVLFPWDKKVNLVWTE